MGKLKFRLDKLTRSLPPSWAELDRLFWQVSERPLQAELDALKASEETITPEQQQIVDAYMTKNSPRAWAAFDAIYPNWGECPELQKALNES